MINRKIKNILYAQQYDMGGMPVRQPFPSAEVERIDPFLLLHHAEVKVPKHIPVEQAGVGPHPHRGFSPVTFIFKGGVHHRDSRGNNNVVYEGGTQWMNAGMGIIHSERPPADIFERGGVQEIIQLWINTPAKHKMDKPSYFPLHAENISSFTSQNELVKINVIAGELENIKGALQPLSSVNTFTTEFKKGGKYFFNIPSSHNLFIYLLDGKLKINKTADVEGKYAAVFENDGDGFEAEALEDTRFFIGSGEPLNETVVSHGPFVMNDQTEILQAFRDYQLGKMGILIEE
jgi:redox-sensitive bicupin YhaK (pirin superfamily)